MTDYQLTPELLDFIRQEKDRHDIRQCLLRYTRGVDRHDKALMMSAYHSDAVDEHGVAQGNPDEFSDWAIGWHGEFQHQHQHIINNTTIEFDGDTAHVETYYTFFGDNRDGPPTLAFGRYIDRFERRGESWRIAYRVCVNQFAGAFNAVDVPEQFLDAMRATGPNTRDSNDISYDRPLKQSRGYVEAA
jgi:ketosteroid isomerase-like protein